MYPFWCMKTRQQVSSGDLSHHLSIRKMGGVRCLYRGFAFYAIASLPAYLVYLTAYTYGKSALGLHYDGKQGASGVNGSSGSSGSSISVGNTNSYGPMLAPLAAGIIADAACLGLYMPVEVVTQRLHLPTRYANAREIIQAMWQCVVESCRWIPGPRRYSKALIESLVIQQRGEAVGVLQRSPCDRRDVGGDQRRVVVHGASGSDWFLCGASLLICVLTRYVHNSSGSTRTLRSSFPQASSPRRVPAPKPKCQVEP